MWLLAIILQVKPLCLVLSKLASQSLSEEFGRGFSETQVRNYRKLYLVFSNLQIQQTMPTESVSDGIVLPI